MDILRPGYERIAHDGGEQDQLRALEMEAVVVSLENVMTFPFVRESVEKEELSLHGLWTDIGEGGLMQYEAGSNTFQSI